MVLRSYGVEDRKQMNKKKIKVVFHPTEVAWKASMVVLGKLAWAMGDRLSM